MPINPLPLSIPFIKDHFPGWGALMEKFDETGLRAKDVNRILGISSRVMNDWEKRGLLQSFFMRPKGQKTDGWRRFKILDLIALGILKEAKRQGIAITTMQSSMELLFAFNERNYDFIPFLVYGQDVAFYTNLNDWIGYYCKQPEENEFQLPIEHLRQSKALFLIPLNQMVNDIFDKLEMPDFKPLKQPDGSFKFVINGVPVALEDLTKQKKGNE
jgi:DNA-binding transcriptional MerR regulator